MKNNLENEFFWNGFWLGAAVGTAVMAVAGFIIFLIMTP